MLFYSKKDLWLLLLVSLSVLVPVGAGLYQLLARSNPAQGWRYIGTAAIAGGAILLATYPLYYEVTYSDLKVRSGFFRWEIPLEEIEEITPSRNLSSAPAWSLERLSVTYLEGGKRKSLLISPEQKDNFLKEISARYPYLRLVEDRLIRVSQ